MKKNRYSNGRSRPMYRNFEDAVNAARLAAGAAGEKRYVHHGMAGFVVLEYPTPATVRVEQPKARARQAGA